MTLLARALTHCVITIDALLTKVPWPLNRISPALSNCPAVLAIPIVRFDEFDVFAARLAKLRGILFQQVVVGYYEVLCTSI